MISQGPRLANFLSLKLSVVNTVSICYEANSVNLSGDRVMSKIYLRPLIAGAILAATGTVAQAACLTVLVQTSRPEAVLVGVYGPKQNFPKPGQHLVNAVVQPMNGVARAEFRSLGAGSYAIAVGQDLNGDGKVNVNFLGIPTEPVAFSNGASASMFGPPSFKDAAVILSESRCGAEAETISIP
jgi:uncharacterized protein (DUF2141 family)